MKTTFPYLITFFLATLFFILGLIYPYRVDSDAAFQLKSVQQLLRGDAHLFNSLTVASPQDLSKDVHAWILHWPPGIPAFFLPLLALGLPLGVAARLTVYILFLLGCIGWIKVAYRIRATYTTVVIFSLVLPLYALTIATTTELTGGDVLPFGIMPWLFLYVLYVSDNYLSSSRTYNYILTHSIILSFLLGSVFWLKYSAFAVSVSLLIYLMLCFLFFKRAHLISLSKKLWLVGVSITSFLLLPVILHLINRFLMGGGDNFYRVKDFTYHPSTTHGLNLLLFFLGTWGLALFQSVVWLMHIIYFSDRWFPLFSNLNFDERTIPLAIAGIPGTLFVIWLLFYAKKIYKKKIIIFTVSTAIIPFIILGYLTYAVKYNFLAYSLRYGSYYFLFTEIILISVLCKLYQDFVRANRQKFKSYIFCISLFLFCVIPNLFILTDFFKNQFFERIGHNYVTTENKIYVPTLSEVDVKSVVDKINGLIKSPKDVVVLALFTNRGSGYGAWLEMKSRTLLLVQMWGNLIHTHGFEGANIFGSSMLTTSKPLRVVLVVSKSLEKDKEFLLKLKERFPQAMGWNHLRDSAESEASVSIYFSDLRAP